MNPIVLKFSVIAALLFETGCVSFIFPFQSSFFSRFSLPELLERNKSQSGLNCSSRAGGGGGGGGGGSGGIGMRESHSSKSESFSCQIAGDTDKFDEGRLIKSLKQSVEADLNESKAKIISSGSPEANSFYFEYSIDNTKGRVEISGKNDSGNLYTLSAILDETKGEAK
jgi:hypothetical protein